MNALVAWMLGFYLAFNFRWLWSKFTQATNQERYALGLLVFSVSLLFLWSTLL